jgi:hypothetical protein
MDNQSNGSAAQSPSAGTTFDPNDTLLTSELELRLQRAAKTSSHAESSATTQVDVPSPDTILPEPSPIESDITVDDSFFKSNSISFDEIPWAEQILTMAADLELRRSAAEMTPETEEREAAEAATMDERVAEAIKQIKNQMPAWALMEMIRNLEVRHGGRFKDGVDRLGIHAPTVEQRNAEWEVLGWGG